MSTVDDKEDQISESIKREHPDHKSSVLGDHGELWIKLKINPSSDEDGDEEEEDFEKDQPERPPQSKTKSNSNTRICQVCSKVFGSGKALGGHMRIHFQTNKDVIFRKKLIKCSQQEPLIKLKKKRKRQAYAAAAAADFAKNKDLWKIKSSSSDHDSAVAGFNKNNTNPTCSICGKNFPSMKSLFGHMRCHPDREWRGIQPPSWAAVKPSPSSSLSDAEPQKTDVDDDDYQHHQVDSADGDGDQTVDLTKTLGGWSVTAKRGRKAIVENIEEDEGMRDAVYHLMSLAQGGDSSSDVKLQVKNRHKFEEFEATNSNSLAYKSENDEDLMTKSAPGSKKKRKKVSLADHPVKELRNEGRKLDGIHLDYMIHMGENSAGAVKETDLFAGKLANLGCQWEEENTWPKEPKEYYADKDCSDSENTLDDRLLIDCKNDERSNGNVIAVKSRKKRKRMKLRDLDQFNPVLTLTTSLEKYRCATCDKCFPTHQALGGHRSSHNKFRMVIQNSYGESTFAAATDEYGTLGNYTPNPGVDESKESDEGAASSHECRIGNKKFLTGQALGGHKRCHWPAAGQMDGPSSQVTSAGEGSGTDRRVMEFDLNEVPPLEEDAGVECDHAAGYGCASSSFNSVEFQGLCA
ncbi:uncharacterized protein [Coffea arabica]|uniref:C2H2-type domain-containing protein n=1 Tax=Coffea arabica TaxID=13443 RepID=A0ABM4UK35_COFAR